MKAGRLIAALLLIGALSTTGCSLMLAGAAVAGVMYVKGAAVKVYDAPISTAVKGVSRTIERLKLTVGSEAGDNLTYTFKGMTGEGDEFTVSLEAKSEKSTEVSIRFGTFGDKSKSVRFHEELMKELD